MWEGWGEGMGGVRIGWEGAHLLGCPGLYSLLCGMGARALFEHLVRGLALCVCGQHPLGQLGAINMLGAQLEAPGAAITCSNRRVPGTWVLVKMEQLLTGEFPYSFHCDGTRKLHHGKWVLITLGCTSMEWDLAKKKVVHSFRPLVYLFCKQQETTESLQMLFYAAQQAYGTYMYHTCTIHVI